MGFLNRLFGPKPGAPPERISESVATLERYVQGIVSHYGEARFQGDIQVRQILSVYAFGGVSALAVQHQMLPPQAHAICLALFNRTFGFAPEDASAKAEAVITAIPDRTSHLYPIIHRGADAFLHWQQHGDDGAAKDFAKVMEHYQSLEKRP